MCIRLISSIVTTGTALLCGLILLTGCKDPGGTGTDGGSSDGGGELYTIGGSVTGLVGTLVLQNQGADDLSLDSDGTFAFVTAVEDGTAYAVTLLSEPVLQHCQVAAGQGTVAGADVDSVVVTCEDKRWYHPQSLEENVSPDTTGVRDPQVVMNAGGDALLAWVQSDGTRQQVFLSERRDGSWTHPGTLGDFVSPDAGVGVDATSSVSPALNDAGDAVVAWTQNDGSADCGGSGCRRVYRSVRQGGAWTHPADLTAGVSFGSLQARGPRAVIDSAGDVSLVWSSTDGADCGGIGCSAIYLGERRAGVWSDPTDPLLSAISPPDGRSREPRIGADDAGGRVVIWVADEADNGCAGNNPCFQVFVSTYRAGAWSHPADRSEGIAPPGQHVTRAELAMSGAGDALVVWQQQDGSQNQIYTSRYISGVWDHPLDATDSLGPAGEAGSAPAAALNAAGDAVVLWLQSDGTNDALWAISSSGSNWTAPVRLSPPGTDVVSSNDGFALSLDDHGNVIVAWVQEDASTACGGGPCAQVFISEYRRGAWHHPASPSDHVSPAGQDARRPDLATDDDGNALLAWEQEDGLAGCSEGACAQTFLSEYR